MNEQFMIDQFGQASKQRGQLLDEGYNRTLRQNMELVRRRKASESSMCESEVNCLTNAPEEGTPKVLLEELYSGFQAQSVAMHKMQKSAKSLG